MEAFGGKTDPILDRSKWRGNFVFRLDPESGSVVREARKPGTERYQVGIPTDPLQVGLPEFPRTTHSGHRSIPLNNRLYRFC